MNPDIRIENCDSIILFRPLTAPGREWLEENTDGMWYAGALAVEARYAGMREIADGATDDGLAVAS